MLPREHRYLLPCCYRRVPEDFVNPKITENITGVVFPALEVDEILSVEGPESFDFPGKTYNLVRVD